MKFIHIVGFVASGKTTIDYNLRLHEKLLGSTDEFPNNNGIGFFHSLLYKVKHKKQNILNCNACDWVFRHRISYKDLMPELIKRNIHTFITSGLSKPFATEETEQLLNDEHTLTIFYNHRSEKRCFKQYMKRCQIQKTEVFDSFEKYIEIANDTVKSLQKIQHFNYNFIKLTGGSLDRFQTVCKEVYGHEIQFKFQRNIEKYLRKHYSEVFDQQYIDRLKEWELI